jgi:multicomponent Na+:H+ antiporter subunit E
MKRLQLSVALFAFWQVLTGSFAISDIIVGLVVSVVLALWAAAFLWDTEEAPILTPGQAVRFVLYVPYLVVEIVRASVYVAEKVLDPRLPIRPAIISHRSPLKRPVSRVVFANSVTLTPGTLTVDVEDHVFKIHCLGDEFADGVASRVLERKVGRVFEKE